MPATLIHNSGTFLSNDEAHIRSRKKMLQMALFQQLGVARLMKYGNDDDAVFTRMVKECVRESVHQNAPECAMHHLKCQRPFFR